MEDKTLKALEALCEVIEDDQAIGAHVETLRDMDEFTDALAAIAAARGTLEAAAAPSLKLKWEMFGGELWCPDDLVVMCDEDEDAKPRVLDMPTIIIKPPYGWAAEPYGGMAAGPEGREPSPAINELIVRIAQAIAAALSDLEVGA